jgi:type IV secretion system protein TrbD
MTYTAQQFPGFSVPVHRCLTEAILLAGAPRGFAIVNGTLAVALGAGLRLWLFGLVIGTIGHVLGMWLARWDAQALSITARHLRLPAIFAIN